MLGSTSRAAVYGTTLVPAWTLWKGDISMVHGKVIRGRWTYVFLLLASVAGCLAILAIVILGTRGVRVALARARDVTRLTRVVVPGSAELVLSRTGAYAVYHEYRSIVDGVPYEGSETPPPLQCTLTSRATGRDIPLVADFVAGNRYSRARGTRAGVLIMSTTIDAPGIYGFSCRYPDGESRPRVVLAFGQNIVWECISSLLGLGRPPAR
jgi:hypothetical protein